MQCTVNEIAGFFDCSVDTIERWCKREYKEGFADIYGKKRELGRISLRRTQWKMAEHNVSMAIWLGKQYLGQAERQDVAITKIDDDSSREMADFFARKKAEGGKIEV
jgi:hypothetical protein